MPAQDLGEDVVVVIGPLVQISRSGGAEVLKVRRAKGTGRSSARTIVDVADVVLRQAEWFLRIGGDFIPTPARCVGARLVEQSGREGVVPDERERIVDLRMVPEVGGPNGTLVVSCGDRHPVNGEGKMVILP
jgi:hypothetical protein